MEFIWRVAVAIALLSIGQVSGKCAPNKPCGRKLKGGLAPVPGCTCPSPNPNLWDDGGKVADDGRGGKWAGGIGGPPGSNEVEVLTLDVGVANKVRSSNASIAAEIARLMNVPVSRVNVTPYSWTPDQFGPAAPAPIPNQEQVAFLQAHEGCDCQGARAAVKVAADTSIMTVTQYKALSDFAKERAAAGDVDEDPEDAPARIQLLSRDPCLVKQLVADPSVYAKRIAQFLGVPEKAVILHPPPVKGTVGLLQLDAIDETEEAMTLLAVKHCTDGTRADEAPAPPGSAGPKKQTASAPVKKKPAAVATASSEDEKEEVSVTAAPPAAVPAVAAPRPAGWPSMLPWPPQATITAAVKALPLAAGTGPVAIAKNKLSLAPPAAPPAPGYEVAQLNATNSTNATNAAMAGVIDAVITGPSHRVVMALKFSNMSYDLLTSNSQWSAAFSTLLKDGLALAGSLPGVHLLNPANIELAFYPAEKTADAEETKPKLVKADAAEAGKSDKAAEKADAGKAKSDKPAEVDDGLPKQPAGKSKSAKAVKKSGIEKETVKLGIIVGSGDSETMPGSNTGLVVEAKLALPLNSALGPVAAKLSTFACNAFEATFLMDPSSKQSLEGFSGGDVKCTAMGAHVQPLAAQEPLQQNRAWISFWNIVVMPPFAKLGGKRLLEMVDTPGTKLAKLLPATLAYVPGIMDRSLGDQNAAAESRLPPPMESSTGFGLRSSRYEQEDLEEQAQRVKDEKSLKERIINTRATYEIAQAKLAKEAGEITKAMVAQAREQFVSAARAHTQALRPSTALRGPAIMPPPRADEGESPYPPVPPTMLAQISRRLRFTSA